jgi:hypothetical protein
MKTGHSCSMHLQSASNDAPVDPTALSTCANKITSGALGGTRTTHDTHVRTRLEKNYEE